jgi:hypothetical protein
VEQIIVCPLGGECEAVTGAKVARCAWYLRIDGVMDDGTKTEDSRCAMAWIPALLIDHSKDNRQQTASLQQVRNIFAGALDKRVGHS